MTALVVLVQIVLPLGLLGWWLLFPAGSALGWLTQVIAVAALLFALARIAQWALPVWWLPWVYAVLWAGIAVWGLLVLPAKAFLPTGGYGWVSLAISTGFLVLGGWLSTLALSGRALPPVEVIDIANPFGPGHYLVGHGGSNRLVNGHMRTLDDSVTRFKAWRGQSYGVDFFGLGPWGFRARGWRPADPTGYAIFGARLHAPCDGTVIAAQGSQPDFQVPDQDPINRLGNYVILRCGDVEIVFAHMREGSLTVSPGQSVTTGAVLGEVGNSGATTEPHLHIHAQRPGSQGAPISGDPLALRIAGRWLVRGDRLQGGWPAEARSVQ
jgi:hypothetical protein